MEDNFIFMGLKEIVEKNNRLSVNDIGLAKAKRIKFDTKHLIELVRENKINKVEISLYILINI